MHLLPYHWDGGQATGYMDDVFVSEESCHNGICDVIRFQNFTKTARFQVQILFFTLKRKSSNTHANGAVQIILKCKIARRRNVANTRSIYRMQQYQVRRDIFDNWEINILLVTLILQSGKQTYRHKSDDHSFYQANKLIRPKDKTSTHNKLRNVCPMNQGGLLTSKLVSAWIGC